MGPLVSHKRPSGEGMNSEAASDRAAPVRTCVRLRTWRAARPWPGCCGSQSAVHAEPDRSPREAVVTCSRSDPHPAQKAVPRVLRTEGAEGVLVPELSTILGS